MQVNTNDKIIAYLTLFSGLALSIVAEYYSIAGLTAIFSAAVIPTIIMGITLGLGKIMATIWVKRNWDTAPWNIKIYLCLAIAVLMIITSIGTFGFLSKAHSDQSLIGGDVQAKIAVYDEKIKTAKENIDANRKALKQMDEAVDQVMGRSTDEKGADKAVTIRRAQQKERSRLLSEIAAEQKTISQLNEERSPIAAEVRKVEAEVGPLKYIAQFVYGETDTAVLERSVTWIIVLIIFVFDPLALILLIASQISFQRMRPVNEEGDSPEKESIDIVESTATVTESIVAQEVAELLPEAVTEVKETTVPVSIDTINALIAEAAEEMRLKKEAERVVEPEEPVIEIKGEYIHDDLPVVVAPTPIVSTEESRVVRTKVFAKPEGYVQNEEQTQSNLWAKTVGKMDMNDPEILNNVAKSKAEE